MRSLAFGTLLPLVIAAAGCSRDGVRVIDAGAVALDDSGVSDVVALPREVVVSVDANLPDGGIGTVVFRPGEKPQLEPTHHLRLSTNLVLRNYRIQVFDESDKALPSDDAPQELADKIIYDINLTEPLKPGHRYTLVLDPQQGALMTDVRGESHAEKRLEFSVAGERERPVVKKAAKHHKR